MNSLIDLCLPFELLWRERCVQFKVIIIIIFIRLSINLEQSERIDAIKEGRLMGDLEDLRSRKAEVGDLLSIFKHEVDTELEQLEFYV